MSHGVCDRVKSRRWQDGALREYGLRCKLVGKKPPLKPKDICLKGKSNFFRQTSSGSFSSNSGRWL